MVVRYECAYVCTCCFRDLLSAKVGSLVEIILMISRTEYGVPDVPGKWLRTGTNYEMGTSAGVLVHTRTWGRADPYSVRRPNVRTGQSRHMFPLASPVRHYIIVHKSIINSAASRPRRTTGSTT